MQIMAVVYISFSHCVSVLEFLCSVGNICMVIPFALNTHLNSDLLVQNICRHIYGNHCKKEKNTAVVKFCDAYQSGSRSNAAVEQI